MSSSYSPSDRKTIETNRIEVYKDFSDIVRIGLEVGDTAIQRFDTCISKSGPSVLLSPAAEPIRQAHQTIRKRGAKMRLITDITLDNIFQCKELMKTFHD